MTLDHLTPEQRARARRLLGEPEPEPDAIKRTGARWFTDIEPKPTPPLLLDRIHPTGHTVLFGAGGCGKGTLASAWIVELTKAGKRVLIADYESHLDEEWMPRILSLGGRDAMAHVIGAEPLSRAWHGRRGRLFDHARDLRELADDAGADVVVIDSITQAGEDLMSPDGASRYGEALQSIERPVLSLAHISKNGDGASPYGATAWSDLGRLTWSIAKMPRDGHVSLLKARKTNNTPGGTAFTVDFTYHPRNPDGSYGLIADVHERPYSQHLGDVIEQVLREAREPMTQQQLRDAVAEHDLWTGEAPKPDTMRVTLKRGAERKPGQRWTKADDDKYQVLP